jgi:hypothetical protein
MKPLTRITIELTQKQAQALAQSIKRNIWEDVRHNAKNDEEAYLIRDAFEELQYALTYAGFSPE